MAKNTKTKEAEVQEPEQSVNDGMALIQQAQEFFDLLKEDGVKFFERNNNTAGTRTRKHAQDLTETMRKIRKAVQAVKNSESEEE